MTAILPHVAAGSVRSIQIGAVAPLGPDGVPSGFVKRAVAGPIDASPLGLAGDAQADHRVHGGIDKAVYGYVWPAYALWRDAFPEHAALLEPGGLGENLTLDDLNEGDVCIGDVVAIGSAVLQVSQPRQPCFKFGLRFNDDRMAHAMIMNGRCGWYYRVLTPGSLVAGDQVVLEDRPNPDWSIARFFHAVTRRTSNATEIAEIMALDGLAFSWRDHFEKRLPS